MASIRKRKDSYQITVSNGRDSAGRQLVETATFRPDPTKTEKQNQKALEKFVFEFEERVKSGKYLDGEKITFQEFSSRWLEEYAAHQLEASTIQLYTYLLNAHIFPAIGHLKLSKIQPLQLNKLYNALSETRKDGKPGGYAAKTIKHVHNIISAIYTTALKWNVCIENPCQRVDTPHITPARDKVKYFTLEQSQTFLSLLDKEYTTTYKAHDRVDDTGKSYHVAEYSETRKLPTQFKLFFLLALFCGCRRGELIALTWDDLDFHDGSLNITKSTSIVNGKPLTKAPKTRSSIRALSVPASVLDIAKAYRKEQLQYRIALGSKWKGDNYIFIQWNGRQMHPDTPYNTFKRVIQRHNASCKDERQKLPEIPLHGLRHTSATLLISQNVDVRTVSGRLGHAQTSTTMDIYAHSLKKMDEVASEKLENLLAHGQ